MNETLLSFLVVRLDQLECPVFLRRELERFPEVEVNAVLSDGILRETSRATEISRPDHVPPGGDLLVRCTSKGLFGVAEDDDYFDPIPLTEHDVQQYAVSLPKLAGLIRQANAIRGSGFTYRDGLVLLGRKKADKGCDLEIYFSILNSDHDVFLSRCNSLGRSSGAIKSVVMTPKRIELSGRSLQGLARSGIIVAAMDDSLQRKSFSIDWNDLLRADANLRQEEQTPEEQVFQRQGRMWTVLYEGLQKHFADSLGMNYIHMLLQESGREIHAAKLRGVCAGAERVFALGSSPDVAIDEQACRKYKERIEDLDAEIEDAEANNDFARKNHLEDERESLVKEISRSTGLHGKCREGSTDRKRARQSVSAAIRRALKVIEKEHRPLWRHLKAVLTIGEYLSYQPDHPTPWIT